MKKLIIGPLILAIMILLPCSTAFADDGISVDVDIYGDDPTVTVNADGNNPAVYINGQDIQKPTAYYYAYENDYDDTDLVEGLQSLRSMLESSEATLITTSEGLVAVIQVLDEHTSNLREVFEYSKEVENKSVSRANEIASMGREQDSRILEMADVLNSSLDSTENNAMRIAELEKSFAEHEKKFGELESDFNRKLAILGGLLGACVLTLLVMGYYRIKNSK